MSNQVNDQLLQKEIDKYNHKMNSLTEKFLEKMRGFLNMKQNKVKEIDQTITDLGQLRGRVETDVDNITLEIQRNEERIRKLNTQQQV